MGGPFWLEEYHIFPPQVKHLWACLAKVGTTGVYSRPDGQAGPFSPGGKPQGGPRTLPVPGPGGGPTHPQGQAGRPWRHDYARKAFS